MFFLRNIFRSTFLTKAPILLNQRRSFTSISKQVALKVYNGHFICAEPNGSIVANRPWIGPWEIFNVEQISSNQIALRSAHGKYLCAEDGGGREIVANRPIRDIWETFTYELVDKNCIALRAHNLQYLCAEDGGGREIVANRSVRNIWETFKIYLPILDQRKFVNLESVEYGTFTNSTNQPVPVKPETSTEPVFVPPGKSYYGFDGFGIRDSSGERVYKVVDGCDANVRDDKVVELDCRNHQIGKVEIPFSGDVKEIAMKLGVWPEKLGGWLDKPPSSDPQGWMPLFKATKEGFKASTSTSGSGIDSNRFPDAHDPDLSDRDRFDRMDRNQFETDRADRASRTA